MMHNKRERERERERERDREREILNIFFYFLFSYLSIWGERYDSTTFSYRYTCTLASVRETGIHTGVSK